MWHSACLVSARHASPPRGRDCQEERGRANRPTGWGLVGLAQTWSSLLLLHNIAQSKVSIRKHGMRKFIKGSYSYWPIFACWWKKAFLKKIVSISHYYSLWLYVDGWTENETPAFLTRQMISFHGGLLTDAHLVWAAGRVLGNRSKSDYVAYWVEGGEQPISPGISFCWSRFYLAFIILSCSFLHRPCYGGAAMKIIRWGFPSLEEAFQALLACQVGKLKLTGFAEPVLSKGHLLERLQSLPSIRLCLLSSKWLRANLL